MSDDDILIFAKAAGIYMPSTGLATVSVVQLRQFAKITFEAQQEKKLQEKRMPVWQVPE